MAVVEREREREREKSYFISIRVIQFFIFKNYKNDECEQYINGHELI
jgi:hypothetical protein